MLTVTRASKRVAAVIALDAASFEARRGRIVGFLGPNGAGETTAWLGLVGRGSTPAEKLSHGNQQRVQLSPGCPGRSGC